MMPGDMFERRRSPERLLGNGFPQPVIWRDTESLEGRIDLLEETE
jgi:hypothetical protein